MNPAVDPYAPGAGTPPPELAGRDAILADAKLAIERNKGGRSARSFMFVGLRGVGKTVLLNEVQSMADEVGAVTDFIEVGANEPLSVTIVSTLRAALLKLDRIKGVSEQVKNWNERCAYPQFVAQRRAPSAGAWRKPLDDRKAAWTYACANRSALCSSDTGLHEILCSPVADIIGTDILMAEKFH